MKSKRKMGRPLDPNAISRVGVSHTFFLSEMDERLVLLILKAKGVGFTGLMRGLVREEAKRLGYNTDVGMPYSSN